MKNDDSTKLVMTLISKLHKIIFSDKSRFSVFQSDGKIKVCREKGVRYKMQKIAPR